MKKVLRAMILPVIVLSRTQPAAGQATPEILNELLFGATYRGDAE